MGLAKGLSEIAVRVPDLTEGVRFYCEGLGLTLSSMEPPCARIMTPDGLALLLAESGEERTEAASGGLTHVCYLAWDADRAFARALAFGAVPTRAPAPYTWDNMRMAFVRSPSGEEIEFRGIRNPDGSFGGPVKDHKHIQQVMHVAVTVPDMPSAISFYEALGAVPKEDWGWGFVMCLPDRRELELFVDGAFVGESGNYDHFTFAAAHPERAHSGMIIAGGMPDGAGMGIGPAGERIAFSPAAARPRGPKLLPDLS